MSAKRSDETKLTMAGRNPAAYQGAVNPPVYHASTILFETLEDLDNYARFPITYGRHGTPGTKALEEAICELEEADLCRLAPSGVAALAVAMLSFLEAGDHVLIADSVYEPTRAFCDRHLARFGVSVTYYDPFIGAGIDDLMEPRTRIVLTESPGTRTFEMQDMPAIIDAVHAQGALVAMDNTWATPLFYKPLAAGVDISIQAATKYLVGHADAMMGTIAVKAPLAAKLKLGYRLLGQCVGPDDAYLTLRGLRTLAVRLQRHQETALTLCRWLEARPEVARVLYPALESDPGHAIWKRDFTGASGLFGVLLKEGTRAQLAAMLDGYAYFGMGFSWGGFESLVTPSRLEGARSATAWTAPGPLLRYHAGLEAPADLIADLEAGFARFHAAA